MSVMYPITTLLQIGIVVCAIGIITHYTMGRAAVVLIPWWILFLAALAVDQLWWTIAREAFADATWLLRVFDTGLDAKLWFEAGVGPFVIKGVMFGALCVTLWVECFWRFRLVAMMLGLAGVAPLLS